ncbi:MAG: protein kinase [Rhodocyclaceae bacterium]|nr:protein kinase [Rhodocyclaceae bacterium]
MANLANAIRIFQSGALSHHEFLAQVDRVLASDQANSERLLEILQEEHTNFPLPPDVYAEVQRRIEHRAEPQPSPDGEETRVQTHPGQHPATPDAPAAMARPEQPGAGPDRIKGVGDTLNGRFVLEECLGFGGMGMVYKALDLRKLEASDRNPYIAIKVLNVQFRGHPKSLIALQREAKKAQKLAHPNIVTVYDFDRDGSMVYLTMEYLTGRPLSHLLRTPDFKGLPYGETLPIVTGMARALAYAHERGFVHCDLKPANVFLTDSGEVKVIDFGIARVFQKPEPDAEATVFDPGSLGGLTPAYASPEMLEHREPDPRDDIYALACITYELLTGRHPFDRLPANQARSAGLRPQRPKKLGRRQWRTLKAALALDREARTATVTRFLDGLSGERRGRTYVTLMAASMAMAGLFAAIFVYFWTFETGREAGEGAPAAPAESPPPVAAQPAAPSLAAIAPILAGVPCAALAPTLRGDTLQVQGYLPGTFAVAPLKNMLGAVPGVRAVNLDVQPVRDDQCGIINALAPYWVRNRQAGGAAGIHTQAPNGELTEGAPLVVNITTPGYDSYVNIDYYVLDGSVVHLVPSLRARDNQAPPNYSATVGSLGNWVISKPFGKEMVVLLVTPVPLFEGLRPESESGAEYLRAVQERLGKIAREQGSDRIAADFVQIATRARKP